MKHTRKILVALIITLTLLMTLVTIPASADNHEHSDVIYEVTSAEFSTYSIVTVDAPIDDTPAVDDTPVTDDKPATDDAPATDDGAESEENDKNKASYIICIAILAVGLALALVSLVLKPKAKPWWMI